MYCSFYATTFQTVLLYACCSYSKPYFGALSDPVSHLFAVLDKCSIKKQDSVRISRFGTFQDVLMIDNYVEHTVCIKRDFCALILQQINGTVGNCGVGGGGGEGAWQVTDCIIYIYYILCII